MNTFGERLRALRLSRCMTQSKIQQLVGMPQNSLSAIESGKFIPKEKEKRQQLASVLETHEEWLTSGQGYPFKVLRGVEFLNQCKSVEGEKAAIDIILSMSSRQRIYFAFDKTRHCFFFQILDDLFLVLYPASSRTDSQILELIEILKKKLISHGFVIWQDVGETIYPDMGVRLADAFSISHLADLFSSTNIQHQPESADKISALLREVEALINEPGFSERLRDFLQSYYQWKHADISSWDKK